MDGALKQGTGRATAQVLAGLAPLSRLPFERLRQLAEQCILKPVPRGRNPLEGLGRSRSVFLLGGEMLLVFPAGGTEVIVGGTDDTRFPVGGRGPVARAKAITDLSLLLMDDDLLDIVLTWDQVAAGEESRASDADSGSRTMGADWAALAGMFSLTNLRHGAFASLPPAHIDELLRRFERVRVRSGDVVLREGDPGDYYYVVESGRCQVERVVGGARVTLAELKSGDTFGEEALVAEARRNATVTAIADGSLLRLAKRDFVELLREPLLQHVTYAEAQERVAHGAQWLDVRYPSEYQQDRLPGALNVPLNEVRNMLSLLDKAREYVVYCQSGRRSSAAAFLFSQRGFSVSVLEGGLWAAGRGP
ncbi:MAG: cyclic nucleotide-binding domain-containing protein [Proteobacteria bacterium]|nr:cyclic nucleotide-binding domain-containing protein [Pseudomonadota bacterium]